MPDEKTKNLVDQISKKQKYKVQAMEGRNKRPRAESSLVGITLMSFAMGLQSNAFLGIFYIGVIVSVLETLGILGKQDLTVSKLLQSNTLYYLAGGVGASIFFVALGYPVPSPEFGLLADLLVSLGELL